MTHYNNLVKLFTSMSHKFSTWDIFKDFIEMAALSFANAVDHSQYWNDREAQYLAIVKKYDKKELDIFPQMLAELTLAFEEEPGDILGKIYCEMGLSNKWTGQFFTPDCVCKFMGKIALGDITKQVEEKGFITVCEPAIGGGSMIINLALSMKEEGVNYQQAMVVTGIDVDIKSIYMSYIQLALMHIPAILIHGNSLTLQTFSNWYTPAYILGGWAFRRQKEKHAQVIELPRAETIIKPVVIDKADKPKYELISLFG